MSRDRGNVFFLLWDAFSSSLFALLCFKSHRKFLCALILLVNSPPFSLLTLFTLHWVFLILRVFSFPFPIGEI